MPCFQMSPASLGMMVPVMAPVMAMMAPVAVVMSVIAGPVIAGSVIAVVGVVVIARRRGRGGHEKRRWRHGYDNARPMMTPCRR